MLNKILISGIKCFDTGEPFSISNSVALVGSGSNVLKKGYGEVIDSHDRIVRFNHAKTLNMEQDVGSKTTDLFINWHVYVNYDMKKDGFSSWEPHFLNRYENVNVILSHPKGNFLLHTADGEKEIDRQDVLDGYGRSNIPEKLKFFVIDEEEIYAYQNFIHDTFNLILSENSGLKTLELSDKIITCTKSPTVGFCAVCCLVSRNIVPNLFGFSLPGDKWDHYFEDRPVADQKSHTHIKELMVLERMNQIGLIKIH